MIRAGRVGALAIALGIGYGAAAAIPSAWADSTDNTTAGSAGAGSTHSRPAHRDRQSRHAGLPPNSAPAAATLPASRAIAPSAAEDIGIASKPKPAPTPTVAPTRTVAPVAAVQQAPTLSIRGNGQPPVLIRRRQTAATELSGIAYGGGSTYYAVGDNGAPTIWQIDSPLGSRTGWIQSPAVAGSINVPMMGPDSEGIALSPERTSAWVSDEINSAISQFSLATGLMLGSVAVPSIYRPANVQSNRGLESLSYGVSTLWTANEEALTQDGPLSTTSAGSWVRIQRFGGADLTPESQYAYRTDPIAAMSPFTTSERSGLVDVLALPDGQVLTLERELGGFIPLYRTRIYLLDLDGATDVSAVPSLSAGGFTPAAKTLLWQGFFTSTNYEGITLGPVLRDGSSPLILVSDDGQGQLGQLQTLFSLKLKGMSAPAGSSVI
jgi:hypothetical protein